MATIKNARIKFPCRLSYVYLTEPRFNEKSEKNEYSVVCLIPKEDEATVKKIRSAIKKVSVARWGEDLKNGPKDFRQKGYFDEHFSRDGKDGYFLRSGNETDSEEKQNCVYFTARDAALPPKMPKQPQCAKMLEDGKWKRLEGQAVDEIYSGCMAEVVIDVYAYESKKGDKGVGCSLKAVMKTGDGERLSGSSPVNLDEFFEGGEAKEEFMSGEDDNYNV